VELRVQASVVVCTYNDDRLPLLRETLRGIAAQQPPCHEVVLVVDHNEALAERLRREQPDAIVVASAGPKGLSGARNTGIETAPGDVVVFLDDDAVPRPGWLARLLAPFDDTTVAGVGGHAEPAWEGGSRPSWFPPELDWVVGCSFAGQLQGDVRNPIGCSMALRAEVLADVGGFATELGRIGTLPLGCEETELGIRVNRAGGRIVLVDDSIVDHFVPHQRASVRYVVHRCYSEGISKAAVQRLAAGDGALGPEQGYVVVLIRALARSLRRGELGRAAVIPLAAVAALAGFARGRMSRSAG
jgi:GT2 family glycosyltransferase